MVGLVDASLVYLLAYVIVDQEVSGSIPESTQKCCKNFLIIETLITSPEFGSRIPVPWKATQRFCA